jgi:hypothetical protein
MFSREFVLGGDVGSQTADRAHRLQEGEYVRRLSGREIQLANIRVAHQRLWAYLAVAVVAGITASCLVLSSHIISPLWILLCAGMALVILQSLTKNASLHSRVQRIVKFYEMGVARCRHEWQGRGIGGEESLPKQHVYACDLDLFGAGSLFELLCTARTGFGRVVLAQWLLNPAECGEVTERQQAVVELRDMLDLREDWASVGRGALDQVDASALRDWAQAPDIPFPGYVQALAIMLPICFIVLAASAHIGIFREDWPWFLAIPIGLEMLLAVFLLKRSRRATANLVLPSFELSLLPPLLDRLQADPFQCPLLKSLQSRLAGSLGGPLKQIRVLSVLVWLVDLRQSEYFALPASLILLGTNLAILVERWRQRNREAMAEWLDSLGQFEALLCLARYCYENPEHTFPAIKSRPAALFRAEELGHPLLDRNACIPCDLELDAEGTQLVLVSGSNMSGKSTLLRSVGLNSVLAFAGAPVRAARLEITPFRIGCSIAVQDSLLQAKSRFQTEIERLKWILDLSRTGPLIFLVDEVLSGTNSNDRLWGARAVIEQWTQNGGIGLVTTHDLALTEVVKALEGRAINVHFEEHYENGEMRFDYRMRPGVLTSTNGANVMAALGLVP